MSTRFNVYLSDDAKDALDRLSQKRSKAETIRKALQVFELIESKKFVLVDVETKERIHLI